MAAARRGVDRPADWTPADRPTRGDACSRCSTSTGRTTRPTCCDALLQDARVHGRRLRRRRAARPGARADAAEPGARRCALPAAVYTELFKNIPLLAIIFLTYFGLASAGRPARASSQAGALSLIIFYAAYLSEIFRAAIGGVHGGQPEAAEALGLSRRRHVRARDLPAGAALALPGTNTMLVDLLKSTSLLVTISAAELMSAGPADHLRDVPRAGGLPRHLGLYFALCYPLSQGLLLVRAPDPRRRAAARRGRPRAALRARRASLLEEGGDGMTDVHHRPTGSPSGSRACASPSTAGVVLDDVDLTSRAATSSASSARAAAARPRCCAASTCSNAPTAARDRGRRRADLRRRPRWSAATSRGCARRSAWSSSASTCSRT